jgi:MFS family permease
VLQHVYECCNTYRDSKRNNSGILFHGWLGENSSWRWVFFINLPFALIVVWLTLWRVPESRNDKASRTLDWPGAVLATLVWGALTYALIKVPASGPLFDLRAGGTVRSRWLPCGRNTIAGAHDLSASLPITRLLRDQPAYVSVICYLLYVPLSHWSGGLVARYGARLPLTIGPPDFGWLMAHFCERIRTQESNPTNHWISRDLIERGSSGECGNCLFWLPPRDSNPDRLLQRQLSYH